MTELEKSVEECEAELLRVEGDPAAMAKVLARLGSNADAIGQWARGIDALRRAILLFDELGDKHGLADALNRLGAVLMQRQSEEARLVLERAGDVARDAGDVSEEATSLHNLARLDEMAAHFERSHELYQRSLVLLRRVGDRRKIASTLSSLGVLLHKRGEDDAALEVWREALSIDEELGVDSGIASTRNNIGLLLVQRADAEASIEHFLVAIAIQQRLGDVGELVIHLSNLAHAYSLLERFDDALTTLRRELVLHEQINDQRGIAATLHEIAELSLAAGIHADVDYARAFDIYVELGDRACAALVEMGRAEAWSCEGEHEKAIALGKHALTIRLELGEESHIGAALNNLALIYSDAGDHSNAIELLERSLAIAQAHGEADEIAIVADNLAAVCENLEARVGRVAAARCLGFFLRHDRLADGRERADRELEMLDAERDADDRGEVCDCGHEVNERERLRI